MSGSVKGGLQAARTNKQIYGEDFYVKVGAKGGSVKHPSTRPFSMNRGLARRAGKKGGTISRRPPGKLYDYR